MVSGGRVKHSIHRTVILIGLALALCQVLSINGQAWSNGGYSADPDNPDYGTHDWIADQALAGQSMDADFLRTTYHADFLLGTEAPDNPAYIGDSTNHHVYLYSDGTIQDDVGADRASSMYQTALSYLRASDYENAAFYIGAMTHYIADMGVFGHTMGSTTDWGAEVHHSDYESYFESILGSLPSPSISYYDRSAYLATIELAYMITLGSGSIKSNVWMDANYDWGDSVFETSAMASLTAAVSAVDAVINHLMTEAAAPIPEFGSSIVLLCAIVAMMAVVVGVTRFSRKRP